MDEIAGRCTLPTRTATRTAARRTYVDAVLEEALRLHATSLARQASRDTELLGHHVPKGTNVILVANGPDFHAPSFAVDAALRHATAKTDHAWDETRDLHAFEPERWLVLNRNPETDQQETVFDANASPQIAFGMGPRSCWGRRLAYLELRMVVTLVIWNFELLDVPPVLADPKASYGIVHRADQCYLRLKVIKQNLCFGVHGKSNDAESLLNSDPARTPVTISPRTWPAFFMKADPTYYTSALAMRMKPSSYRQAKSLAFLDTAVACRKASCSLDRVLALSYAT
ncbi:Cytochrome P450 [Akanthomyces lecanii RCEF 1005]|uniref:Cytochrome P450 n=1 Tax=Akanthomyces lecanii RCEF 1005 TaxID=1081108 RepID=A0A168KWH2_CORDF|nr:Cytochrome P450 [Akanthomyces lecanii RCEF 1005]